MSWIVRGDTPGSYDFQALYHGDARSIGVPVSLSARTQKPVVVSDAGDLKVVVDGGDHTYANYPYDVRLGLRNDGPNTVYNPSLKVDLNAADDFDCAPGGDRHALRRQRASRRNRLVRQLPVLPAAVRSARARVLVRRAGRWQELRRGAHLQPPDNCHARHRVPDRRRRRPRWVNGHLGRGTRRHRLQAVPRRDLGHLLR